MVIKNVKIVVSCFFILNPKTCNRFENYLSWNFAGLEDVYFSNKLPEFDRTKSQNVTALVGKTTFLTCSVKNLKHNQKVNHGFMKGTVCWLKYIILFCVKNLIFMTKSIIKQLFAQSTTKHAPDMTVYL